MASLTGGPACTCCEHCPFAFLNISETATIFISANALWFGAEHVPCFARVEVDHHGGATHREADRLIRTASQETRKARRAFLVESSISQVFIHVVYLYACAHHLPSCILRPHLTGHDRPHGLEKGIVFTKVVQVGRSLEEKPRQSLKSPSGMIQFCRLTSQ